MTSRFTATSHLDSARTQPYHIFDHRMEVAERGKEPGQLHGPKGVAIDPNTKEIYVVQSNPTCISIFSSIGEFIKIFTSKYMTSPWGIAIQQDNIYLTDILSHDVIHFKKETTGFSFVDKQGEYGQTIGKFDIPKQLTISSKGDVFIADCWNNRVQVLDSDLHYQSQISHDSLKNPEDIKLTVEEVYVLCACGPPFIHVFSYTGEKIRSVTTSTHSSFFCLDSFGNIIIKNRTTDRINIFTKYGALLDTFKGQGYIVGSIQNPHGIALTDDFKLVVGFSSKICLCIFS